MKAALIERPNVLRVGDIPEPEPGDYDAVCQSLYGAICTGTDLHLIAGEVFSSLRYPTVLGHESVGRVVATGKRVRHLKIGDLVTRVRVYPGPESAYGAHWGGFVEYGIARDHQAMSEDGLPRRHWTRFRPNQVVPPGVDPASATMIITWRETLSYIIRMGVGQGSRVLIIGSGGNALAFVAHARNLGAECIAVVGSRRRAREAKQAGATHCFDYKAATARAIMDARPDGFDFIIDVVGKKGMLNTFLPALRPGGTLAIYGLDDRQFHDAPFDLSMDGGGLMPAIKNRLRRALRCVRSRARQQAKLSLAAQEMALLGITPDVAPGPVAWYDGGADEAEVHDQIMSHIQQGRLKADLWLNVDKPFPLENIADAFDALRSRKMIKALIDLSPDR